MKFFIAIFTALSTVSAIPDQTQIILNSQGQPDQYFSIEDVTSTLPYGGKVSCNEACRVLENLYPTAVHTVGSKSYDERRCDFFSQRQSDAEPLCFFVPREPYHIAQALRILQAASCHFAVKSGGHSTFPGSSNSQGGVTIDLKELNQVIFDSRAGIATIGTGNKWNRVYQVLDRFEVTVPGARTGSVGVGGFLLGGGISFFSGINGLACDNVKNFEVVLANGSIINVNDNSAPDLFRALKGGGGNFGIVTRADISIIPQKTIWGGRRNYTWSQVDDISRFYVKYGLQAPNLPSCSAIFSIVARDGHFVPTMDLYNVAPDINPTLFADLAKIEPIADTISLQNISSLAEINYINQPDGLRETYWTSSFKLNYLILQVIVKAFHDHFKEPARLPGAEIRLIVQVITTGMIEKMNRGGGNSLGLLAVDGPILLLNPTIAWQSTTYDQTLIQTMTLFLQDIDAYARAYGLKHKFLYMNYASEYQSVIASYTADEHLKLKDVSRRYDPSQVFQQLSKGYFKVFGLACPSGVCI